MRLNINMDKLRKALERMDRQEIAALEADARAMRALSDEALDRGGLTGWFVWWVAGAYADGWELRVRIERWRAAR